MADISKATPRPWIQCLDREAKTVEFLPAGRPQATTGVVVSIATEEGEANAALIYAALRDSSVQLGTIGMLTKLSAARERQFTACRVLRDELIVALREAEQSLTAMVQVLDLPPDGKNTKTLGIVRVALAKAGSMEQAEPTDG